MRNVAEEIKALILCSIPFFSKICAIYKIICKNMVELDNPWMMTWVLCMLAN